VNDIKHSTSIPEPRVARSRRSLLIAAGTLGLSACASDSLSLLGASFGSGRRGGSGYPISDADIAAIPYASLGVRIGSSAGVVMILASIDGEKLNWVSADRVVLITERGRLVKTIGMPRDLLATRATGSDPLPLVIRGDSQANQARISRIIDLRPKDDFSVPVESRCTVRSEETLTILGKPRKLLRVEERVVVRKWRWSTDNLFWVDPTTAKIWKSRQQFCPDVPAITMEVLRPAATA